jgi:hypothetical protein
LWCIAFSVLFKGLTLQFDVGPDGWLRTGE